MGRRIARAVLGWAVNRDIHRKRKAVAAYDAYRIAAESANGANRVRNDTSSVEAFNHGIRAKVNARAIADQKLIEMQTADRASTRAHQRVDRIKRILGKRSRS
jgi:hypothetical protein